jgi:hypothetical protein
MVVSDNSGSGEASKIFFTYKKHGSHGNWSKLFDEQ